MKFLKVILYIFLALVGIGIILGLVGPKTYKVERSTVISASPDAVWPYVSSLKKANDWSPFVRQDTAMMIEYTGDEGTVGSTSKWESKKMGKGEQTIVSLDPNKNVNTQLTFYMPWGSSKSDAYFNLEPDAAGTKVTWGMGGKNDFIGRIFGSLMNMDKAVGPSYEEGLANLKSTVESGATMASMPSGLSEIKMADYPGGTYVGVRKEIKMAEMETFFEQGFGTIMGGLQKSGINPTTGALGMYYKWDMEKGETDVAAAIGVPAGTKAPDGTTVFTLPSSKSVSVTLTGGYSGLYGAHMSLDEYLKANNLEQLSPAIEEYVVDMMTEQDTNKLVTVVTYLVK